MTHNAGASPAQSEPGQAATAPCGVGLHRAIVEAAEVGLALVDTGRCVSYANTAMAGLLGATVDELVGQRLEDILDDSALDVLDRRRRGGLAKIADRFELAVLDRWGERRWLAVSLAPLEEPGTAPAGHVVVCADVTDRKHLEIALRHVELYDRLTQLPNRVLLLDRLQQLTAEHEATGEPFAVLLCHVHGLSVIQHERGPEVAEDVLVAVARRLQDADRGQDTVARFASREFAILCPGADGPTVTALAGTVRAALRTTFEVAGERMHVPVSLGVATSADVAAGDLLRAAGQALLAARAHGPGRVVVHDPVRAGTEPDRVGLAADLRRALEEDELELHYQPIVRLGSGRPVGVEALLRWNRPGRGGLPVSDLVRVAEETGLIGDLGEWVLRRACHEAASCGGPATLDWYVGVNLSPREFLDDGLTDRVRDLLRASGLAPRRLCLEVTETTVLADLPVAVDTARRLTGLGVRLALDDFGTGYSSLENLRRLPVDMIKVEGSFVAGLGSRPEDSAIVASVVSLAAALGVQTVAEGVETKAQEEALRRLGCPTGQGFLWSPAVPLKALPATLEQLCAPVRRLPRLRVPVAGHDVAARIMALSHSGASATSIAAALNADGLRTPQGLRWHRNRVLDVIAGQGGVAPSS